MGMATQAGVIGLTQHKGALGSNPRSGNFFLQLLPSHQIETNHELFVLFLFLLLFTSYHTVSQH